MKKIVTIALVVCMACSMPTFSIDSIAAGTMIVVATTYCPIKDDNGNVIMTAPPGYPMKAIARRDQTSELRVVFILIMPGVPVEQRPFEEGWVSMHNVRPEK